MSSGAFTRTQKSPKFEFADVAFQAEMAPFWAQKFISTDITFSYRFIRTIYIVNKRLTYDIHWKYFSK